jgi:uncharacterized protein
MRRSTPGLVPFFVYLVVFFAAWTGYVLWVYPWLRSLGEASLWYALLNIALRLTLWVLPVWWYLRRVDRVDPLEFLQLKRNWKRGVLVGLALGLLIFLGTWLRHGPPRPDRQSVTWNSLLCTSVLIGFIEEIPFRGFILQKLTGWVGFWAANLLSSLLFLAIHLPGWLALGGFRVETALTIFIFGALMALVLRYSRSLWGCILAHSLNDCISAVLFSI